MARLEDAIAQALEASRLKEQVIRAEARPLSHAAAALVEVLAAGRSVHVLGDGPGVHLAAYLSEALRSSQARPLPIRALRLREVEAFTRAKDLLLVVAPSPSEPLTGALGALAARGELRLVCLGGQGTTRLAALCDVGIEIPGAAPAAAEVILSLGTVLGGLLAQGLGAPGAVEAGPSPKPSPKPSFSDLGVIDYESDDGSTRAEPATGEGSLLATEIEHGLAPPTDPRGVSRQRERANDTQVRFRCGACMEIVKVERRFAGRRGQCPRCFCEFTIPRVSETGRSPRNAPPSAVPVPRGSSSSSPSSSHVAPRSRSRTRRRTRAERRRSTRFNVKDALVTWSSGGYPDGRTYLEPHLLEDLSLTGLRFVGRNPSFHVGDVCFFAVDFPAFPDPVRFKGEIRRLVDLEHEPGFSAGVRFLEYADDAELKIRRLLDQAPLRDVRRK